MEGLAVNEVARLLGVSDMQVGRLIRRGDLQAERFGRSWVIERSSFNRYRRLRPGRGRPLLPRKAWEKLASASFDSIESVECLAIDVRRKDRPTRLWIAPGKMAELLNDERVVLSGVAAAARLGAAVSEFPPHQIYVKESDLACILVDFRIQSGERYNITVRSVDDKLWPFGISDTKPVSVEGGRILHVKTAMWQAVVIDLVEDGDMRSAAELLREVQP